MSAPHQGRRPWRIVHSESSLGWGGQEHRVLAELTGFQSRGSTVSLITPPESQLWKRARENSIPATPLEAGRLTIPFAIARTTQWLRRWRPDIVNPHSSRDGWVVGIAARLAKTPFVVRSRHIDVHYPNAWISRHAFTTLADHVISTSNSITAHLQERFKLPAGHCSTIPTGIDLELFSPSGPRAELLPSDEAGAIPVIGMVSVLRSWKGHPTFLRAAKQLRAENFNGRFVIVGEGPQRERIQHLIAEMNLGGSVTLVGHRDDIPAVLRSLNALVIASDRHEGVPQVGLQALATQTPVIGSDAGGTPEVIRHGETGRIFPAGDDGALAHAIRATLGDKSATEAMAARGRAAVEARHSLNAMLDTLDALYGQNVK